MSGFAVTAHSRASGNPEVISGQLGPRFRADERVGRLAISVEGLRGALLWCLGFSGAFVFIEPSPYEIMGLLTMLVFALSGLSLRAAVSPLALALIIINVGYASSVVQVSDQLKPVTWVLISIFLALTAIFYAAMLGTCSPDC
jgi:hypothetical protein